MSRIAAVIALIAGDVPGVSAISPLGGITPPPVPPSPAYPYITVVEVMDKELESLTGRSGMVRSIIQVSSWSKDYEEAWTCRENVKNTLLPYTGVALDQVVSGVNYNTGAELYDDARQLHQVIARFFVWWS